MRVIKDYKFFFYNNDPIDCPIQGFRILVNGQAYENENIIKLNKEGNKILVYPYKFDNPNLDEIFVF